MAEPKWIWLSFLVCLLSQCVHTLQGDATPPGIPVGIEDGTIPDSRLTASSEYSYSFAPQRVRLNLIADYSTNLAGGWLSALDDTDPWIQVDLSTACRISGVATQGREDYDYWVTSFKVACSMDNITFDTVQDQAGDMVFTGNSDRNTVVYHTLPVVKMCRYVRLLPITYYRHRCMRMEVYQEASHYSTGYPTSTLQPTTSEQETNLICDSTSMTLVMDRSLLEIGDEARDVHFKDEACVGYDHDSQHIAITTAYDRCGTQQEQDEIYMMFSNMVTYYNPRPANGTNQVITREHYLHIPVICNLEREQVLGDSFIPQINFYNDTEEGYGKFSLSLQRYTDSSFYRVVNDSGQVKLGTPLYFGVGLTSVTNLTLLIESCWATSSPHPLDDHRYDIIDNGCAVDSTTYIYNSYVPTFKGFRVDAFTFIGDYDQVYVHCTILICDNSDSSSRCAQGCLTRSRRSLQPTGSRSKPHTITNGPLSDASHFQQAMIADNGSDGAEISDPLMIAAVTALCVLIALTAIMSLVIVRMRRHRPELIGYRRVGVTEENY